MGVEYNPRSIDAMFAAILTRLDNQDRDVAKRHQDNAKVLEDILVQARTTNGRVTKLENGRRYFAGWVGGVSALGGFLYSLFVYFTK